MAVSNHRKFLALARPRLGHLFAYLPKQPGYNKRLPLAPTIAEALLNLAVRSPSFCDNLRLLDSTSVPCGQSHQTSPSQRLAGYGGYGWCRSRSRTSGALACIGCARPTACPVALELAAAIVPERVVAAEMLQRVALDRYTVIADKGSASEEFEQIGLLPGRALTVLEVRTRSEPSP